MNKTGQGWCSLNTHDYTLIHGITTCKRCGFIPGIDTHRMVTE